MKTYLFYDIETTGLNKAFDQILHFAAIRTDLDFNELKRYELKVKLNVDVIPSPMAMLTHRMPLNEIHEGISEYEAIQQIHRWMNEPGTISLGYNTLGFDDEFLRFSFYRNLLPSYTHQYLNDCSRMDIFPMTVMYYLFKDTILKWPEKEGKISLKLEDLNHTNQLVAGRSHHAMTDVEATLALAKKMASESIMWHYLQDLFQKNTEQKSLQQLGADGALMVFSKFGFQNAFQSQVFCLGNHFHYKNQTLWLRLDDKDFEGATAETILALSFVIPKKPGEPGFLLPLKDRFLQKIAPERIALTNKNRQWLKDNPALLQFLSNHYRDYKYPDRPETDVDASLYLNGFWKPQEEAFCKAFHDVDAREKSRLIEELHNPRLAALATRILGRHFPNSMNTDQKETFSNYRKVIYNALEGPAIVDYKGSPKLTKNAALADILKIQDEKILDLEQLELLDDLKSYLT